MYTLQDARNDVKHIGISDDVRRSMQNTMKDCGNISFYRCDPYLRACAEYLGYVEDTEKSNKFTIVFIQP